MEDEDSPIMFDSDQSGRRTGLPMSEKADNLGKTEL